MKRNLYQKGNAILNRIERNLYIIQLVMWDKQNRLYYHNLTTIQAETEEKAIEEFCKIIA